MLPPHSQGSYSVCLNLVWYHLKSPWPVRAARRRCKSQRSSWSAGGQVEGASVSPRFAYLGVIFVCHHVWCACRPCARANVLMPATEGRAPSGTGRDAPSLALASAFSFPVIPLCPGTQWTVMWWFSMAACISKKASCELSGAFPKSPVATAELSRQICIGVPGKSRRAAWRPCRAPSASPSKTSLGSAKRPHPDAFSCWFLYTTKPYPTAPLASLDPSLYTTTWVGGRLRSHMRKAFAAAFLPAVTIGWVVGGYRTSLIVGRGHSGRSSAVRCNLEDARIGRPARLPVRAIFLGMQLLKG